MNSKIEEIRNNLSSHLGNFPYTDQFNPYLLWLDAHYLLDEVDYLNKQLELEQEVTT